MVGIQAFRRYAGVIPEDRYHSLMRSVVSAESSLAE